MSSLTASSSDDELYVRERLPEPRGYILIAPTEWKILPIDVCTCCFLQQMHLESETKFSYQRIFRGTPTGGTARTFPLAVAVISVEEVRATHFVCRRVSHSTLFQYPARAKLLAFHGILDAFSVAIVNVSKTRPQAPPAVHLDPSPIRSSHKNLAPKPAATNMMAHCTVLVARLGRTRTSETPWPPTRWAYPPRFIRNATLKMLTAHLENAASWCVGGLLFGFPLVLNVDRSPIGLCSLVRHGQERQLLAEPTSVRHTYPCIETHSG